MDDDDDEEEAKIIPFIKFRERAFSECPRPRQKKQQSISSWTLNRAQSDSDLSHIDKEKTFASETRRSGVLPTELLAKVVMALGGYRVGDSEEQQRRMSTYSSPMGTQGFSDSQVLASEQSYNSNWSIPGSERGNVTPPKMIAKRLRATSEIRIPIEESVKVSD